MAKITKEQKEQMKEMIKNGSTQKQVAIHFKIALSTVQYHINNDTKQNVLKRAREFSKKNYKKRKPRRKYIRNYMSNRRKTDKEFKEKQNEYNKERYRDKSQYYLKVIGEKI